MPRRISPRARRCPSRPTACRGTDRQRHHDQAEAAMPENRITKFRGLLAGANEEDQAEMAFEALQAMDAAAVIDVIVGWAEQTDKLFELNQALLEHMAASAPKLPPGDELLDPEGHPT